MAEDKFCSFAFASRLALYVELTHSLVYSAKEKVKRPARKLIPVTEVCLTATNSSKFLGRYLRESVREESFLFFIILHF